MILEYVSPYLLQTTTSDQGDLILWYVIFTVVVVVFVVLILIFRSFLIHRTGRTGEPTIDFDSLHKMKDTGLISDEEMSRAREAIKKYMIASLEGEKKEEKITDIPAHERKKTPEEIKPKPRIEVPETPLHDVSPPKEPGGKKKPPQKPLDVEDLYRKGLLTEEEYEKLRDFFDKQNKKSS